jgi:hypothetical protein
VFVTTSLPNNGRTAHFAVSYDDSLSKANGLDRAVDLLNYCEGDLALIMSWFVGVNFQFAFPINVEITGESGGAQWTDPADILLLGGGFHPTVEIKPGPMPTTTRIRYLLVAEVTEMFMASQRKQWFGETRFSAANEGSMGESLSRFLASEFLSATGTSKSIPGGAVVPLWLNDPLRPNFVDVAPDDFMPGLATGCGTCFLFFLKYQLGNSIQQIIKASASSLAGVYTNLTGKTDGWQAFKSLVDRHYPGDGGLTKYFPPLDNIFPVADLHSFSAPTELSWAVNSTRNLAWVFLTDPAPVSVRVAFSSDNRSVLDLPASQAVSSGAPVILTVSPQSAAFTSTVVNLTASYAGTSVTTAVKVVRPEDLPVAPLQIVPANDEDPCAQHLVAGTSQRFEVMNPGVIMDPTGLTYHWTVNGASAPVTAAPTLAIPSLPSAGTKVSIAVTLTNRDGIRATGKYQFTTVAPRHGLGEDIRRLNCSLERLRAANAQVPAWTPIEEVEILPDTEQLLNIQNHAKRVVSAAERVIASVKATRSEESNLERRRTRREARPIQR